jgi:cell division septation protein DedD
MVRHLLAALLPLLMVGCSSTPLGQQLGASFDAPPPPAEPKPVAKLDPKAKPVAKTEPEPAPTAASEPVEQPEPAAEAVTASKPEQQPAPTPQQQEEAGEPRDPQPYRVILRLPSADPSAPAEAVTKALRAAGLPFEVETIERLQPAKQP